MPTRRDLLRAAALTVATATAGCGQRLGGTPTGADESPAGTRTQPRPSVYVTDYLVSFEHGRGRFEGQLAARDPRLVGESGDEFDPETGRFEVGGGPDDRDALRFAEGSLRGIGFRVEGGRADVYRGGALVATAARTYSLDLTPTPTPTPTPTRTSTPTPGTAAVPVVRNEVPEPGSSSGVVAAYVTVLRDGEPVAGERVRYADRGGSPDDPAGRTGPRGRVIFLEGTGPRPANCQRVRAGTAVADLGCNHEAIFDVRFRLGDGTASIDRVADRVPPAVLADPRSRL